MNLINLFADIVDNYQPKQTYYGVPDVDPINSNIDIRIIIVAVGVIVIGAVLGIDLLIKKIKQKNDINNAQALYGPPPNLAKRYKAEPPEDLYGCPRPDDMDEPDESTEDDN